jgi:hypothetical protein
MPPFTPSIVATIRPGPLDTTFAFPTSTVPSPSYKQT